MLTSATMLWDSVDSAHIQEGGEMARVVKGRHSADTGDLDEFVVFLIGMRINRLSQVWRCLRIFLASSSSFLRQSSRTLYAKIVV